MLDEILDLEPLEWLELECFIYKGNTWNQRYKVNGCSSLFVNQYGDRFSCCREKNHSGDCAWDRENELADEFKDRIYHGRPWLLKVEPSQNSS